MAPPEKITAEDAQQVTDHTAREDGSSSPITTADVRKALRAMHSHSTSELPICNLASQIMERLDKDGHTYRISHDKDGPFQSLNQSGLTEPERILAASCINERHGTGHLSGMPPYNFGEELPTGPKWLKAKDTQLPTGETNRVVVANPDAGLNPGTQPELLKTDAGRKPLGPLAGAVVEPQALEPPPIIGTKGAPEVVKAPDPEVVKALPQPLASAQLADHRPDQVISTGSESPPKVQETSPRSLPEKLWNPADAAQPTIDLFNQGKIAEATASLKALQEDSKNREFGAWRHEIEVLNQKVDLSKLNMKDVGQIMGTDASGNLITASADLSKEQTRLPSSPDKPKSEFAFWTPSYTVFGHSVFGGSYLDRAGAAQVDRVDQYKKDVEAAKALYVSPDQMRIKDSISPIVDAFKAGDYASAIQKLKDLQDADKPQEPQMWMRHIQAVNANLDFTKLGLHDVGQIIGVDDKGKLLTASANLEEVQTRDVKNPDHIEKQENPNAGYVWPFTRMLGDQKTAGQIAQVKEVVQEASEARLAELGPGWHHVSFTSDGEQREADIYVGKGVDPSKPAPLVYNFHGAGPDSGRGIAEGDTHASRWADANHAIVAYPLAEVHTQPVGNLGGVAGFFKFANPDQVYHAWQTMPNSGLNETRLTYDDQHYVKALDTELSRQLNIDPNRKIMFVFSDSSGLAKNVALDIGASAVIENHGGIKSDLTLPENAGIAYFAVNGEKDPVVPRAGASVYNGFLGNWELRWPKLANADPTRNFNEFAAANGCSGSPQKTESPGQIRTEFTPDQCTTHKPVVEIDRPEDGHAVDNPDPSLLSDIFEIFLGKKDKTYDAFAATVNEALKHPKNGS